MAFWLTTMRRPKYLTPIKREVADFAITVERDGIRIADMFAMIDRPASATQVVLA
ncbi:hypothetical protein [Ramlibacter sp.]|uniref:hypothetical protein n=1 Tax=Ramlibacter sp. TaxID=1917967 RepID=UPI003D0C8E29